MLGFENVPKGKRLKYFKDYYLVPTIVLLIGIIMVVSIVKAMFFRERDDLSILVTAAASDFSAAHAEIIENGIIDNYDVDFNGNGNEKVVINDAIFVTMQEDFRSVEQDMVAATKLTAVIEASQCTIQIVDENMYNYLLAENMIETYENLEKYGLKGEGYIKIPLSETKFDPKANPPLYLTVRPEVTTRLGNEEYTKHIQLVKQIIN